MSNASSQIELYNRLSGRIELEKVPGEALLRFCYKTSAGGWICKWIVSRRLFSALYGRLFDQHWSRRHIDGFIADNRIDMSEVEVPEGGFATFNDFFTRRLAPGARPVDPDPAHLTAPADSRLKVFELKHQTVLNIKGRSLTVAQLLGTDRFPSIFNGGLCLQFRLAPCDYHRFGFIESGLQGPIHSLGGRLYSVNPIALRQMPAIWGQNYRHWCFIQTPTMGTILQIEVGATVVGSIIQHHMSGGECVRGAEKGYFRMGGSTVLAILPAGCVKIDADILQYSRQGIETLVRYGEKVGRIKTG